MPDPSVSVVMAVYNGGPHLQASVESVLSQTLSDLELIVVNDGSTDGSTEILQHLALQDQRVRVFNQANQGLTRALIRGCALARGRLIARQDAADVSLPDRLRLQVEMFDSQPTVRVVSCWSAVIGPEDEELVIDRRELEPADATRRLRASEVLRIENPRHGTTLFRRSDYLAAGGYRPEFSLAQDCDLWLRLTDGGLLSYVPQVLYLERFSPACLSMTFQEEQVDLGRIALELTEARRVGGSEAPLLAKAAQVRPWKGVRVPSTLREARGSYFIGRCLLDRRDPRARAYLRAAARGRPWDVKTWLFLALSLLRA
jgi:glycosyltransferase involved in cell wall biosynthesis